MSEQRIAQERICRTVDGRYVPDGHEDAAFLVVGEGGPLPADFTGFGDVADIAVEAPPDAVVEQLVEGEPAPEAAIDNEPPDPGMTENGKPVPDPPAAKASKKPKG